MNILERDETMDKRPPYNPAAVCTKCGFKEVGIEYHHRWNCPWGYCAENHLHRTCMRCNYQWIEAPVDAKEEETK